MEHIFVRRVVFIGNTIFSAEELGKVTAPYENREVTFEELQTLRRALTLYYVKQGYINSGVVIPDQAVVDGIIGFHIIEGQLTTIEIEGNQHFRSCYFHDRLSQVAGPPVNINHLQQALQRLQQDPRISWVQAKLNPGLRPGEGILKVRVKEKNPYQLGMKVSNNQSPSVGAIRRELLIAHQNLTGNGDSLESGFGWTEGLNDIRISYALPLTPGDTSLKFRFWESDSTVIEDLLKDLDIESTSKIYGITLSHPFCRTSGAELSLALTAELHHSRTYLLGEPFSFSSGAKDGRTDVTVLGFSQDWIDRSPVKVLAARSSFKVGIDALGATVNSSDVDGKFLSWSGQIQWIRRLNFINSQMVFRTDMQLTDDPLLPLEKFAIGGINSVRGYRPNLLVRDNGIAASLEFRIPVIHNRQKESFFQLASFVDFGRAWNTGNNISGPESISSVGMGIRWAMSKMINLHLYAGFPLRDMETSQDDLQDHGIHFQLNGQVF